MTSEQRILLRETFENLMPLPKRFGVAFYARLFALDPGLRHLFRGDVDRQASMLAEALTLAVMQLIDQGKVSDEIRELGRRHRAYGVADDHYATFGAALLSTFEESLGAAFTPPTREAWSEAWDQLAAAMRAAARAGLAPEGRRDHS